MEQKFYQLLHKLNCETKHFLPDNFLRQARPNFFSIGSSKFLLFWTLGVKKLPLFALTIMSNHVFRCVYSFFSNDKLARLLLAQICHFECVLYRGITVWDRCVNLCQGVSSLLWLENFLCVCRACVIANNKSYTHTHTHTYTHTTHSQTHSFKTLLSEWK